MIGRPTTLGPKIERDLWFSPTPLSELYSDCSLKPTLELGGAGLQAISETPAGIVLGIIAVSFSLTGAWAIAGLFAFFFVFL